MVVVVVVVFGFIEASKNIITKRMNTPKIINPKEWCAFSGADVGDAFFGFSAPLFFAVSSSLPLSSAFISKYCSFVISPLA